MGILINILILIIAFFGNFGELNSWGYQEEVLATRSVRRKISPDLSKLEHKTVDYRGKVINVLIDPLGSGTRVFKASYSGNFVPSSGHYRKMRFVTRMFYAEGLRMVEYLAPNGALLGVRAPNPHAFIANPLIQEPDETTWFIAYDGRSFKVKGNPNTVHATKIEIMPRTGFPDPRITSSDIREKAHMLGLRFLVVKCGPKQGICGAELDPEIQG